MCMQPGRSQYQHGCSVCYMQAASKLKLEQCVCVCVGSHCYSAVGRLRNRVGGLHWQLDCVPILAGPNSCPLVTGLWTVVMLAIRPCSSTYYHVPRASAKWKQLHQASLQQQDKAASTKYSLRKNTFINLCHSHWLPVLYLGGGGGAPSQGDMKYEVIHILMRSLFHLQFFKVAEMSFSPLNPQARLVRPFALPPTRRDSQLTYLKGVYISLIARRGRVWLLTVHLVLCVCVCVSGFANNASIVSCDQCKDQVALAGRLDL